MKAVIMAGGKGTRLRPLTSNQPKPMIPIVNKPCMEHIVNLLKRHDFTDILVTVGFMPDVIQKYFGDGSDWDVDMEFSVEDEPMGTAGSVKLAGDRLSERFIVVSGDALTDADLAKAVAFHEDRGAEATLVLQEVDDPSEFGIVVVDDEGRVERFLEKPDPEEVFSYTANTGIYVLEPGVLDDIPAGEEYDFADDLFPKLLDAGRPVYGYVTEKPYWEDIGNIGQYMDAQKAVLNGEVRGVRPPGEEVREGVYLGRGVRSRRINSKSRSCSATTSGLPPAPASGLIRWSGLMSRSLRVPRWYGARWPKARLSGKARISTGPWLAARAMFGRRPGFWRAAPSVTAWRLGRRRRSSSG